MTNETTQTTQTEQTNYAIGARLKSAREALGMDKKDVAAQLRLNENVIAMMETDEYPNSLPTIFIRGYLRSYGKFLELPDYVIKEALAPITPPVKEAPQPEAKNTAVVPKLNKKIMMKTVNLVIALTLVSMVWLWWHNHNTTSVVAQADRNLAIPFDMGAPEAAAASAATPFIAEPVNTGNSTANQSINIPLAPQVNHALSDATIKPVTAAATANEPAAAKAPVNSQPQVAAPQNKVKTTSADEDDYDDVE